MLAAGAAEIEGVTGHWYAVLGESLFTMHLVLVWTARGHTYGVGFHTITRASRRLGLEVAQHLRFIGST
jgi:hypothetical protein